MRGAGFEADPQGEVRFSYGRDFQNNSKLYYRDVGGEWELVNDESGIDETISVTVDPSKPVRVVRDLSSRLSG